MKILYSSKFLRAYKKLPRDIKLLAEKKEIIFRKNPFDKRLGAHKLHGSLKDFWSFSVDARYRIVFELGDGDEIYFHTVGDHDVYK